LVLCKLNRAITFIANLINWITRLAVWVFLDAKDAWISILPIALIIGCGWLIFGLDEQGIRISGLVLELLGILVVARGLSESRKLFGRPSLYQSFLRWTERRPRFGAPKYVLNAEGSCFAVNGSDSAMARGFVGTSAHTLEERIVLLERRLNLADTQIQEGRRKLEEEAKNRMEAIVSEEVARIEGDAIVQKQLEEAVVGGINLETVGIVWLACGVTLSSLSVELDCLISKLAGA